jgi:hypothetical protein
MTLSDLPKARAVDAGLKSHGSLAMQALVVAFSDALNEEGALHSEAPPPLPAPTGAPPLGSVMQLAKEWEQDVSLTEEETCSVCRGTGYSGPAVLCDSCERNETHLHCLRAPVLESQVSNGDNWYCDVCCSKRNIEPGNFHPSPEELAKRKLKATVKGVIMTGRLKKLTSTQI